MTEIATNGNGPETAVPEKKTSLLAPIRAAWEAAGAKNPGPDEAKQLKLGYLRARAKHDADLKAAEDSAKVTSEAAHRIMLATGAITVTLDGVDHVPMCRDGVFFFRKRSSKPALEL
jgi:hypothetical protein